jgi:nitroreductase
MKSFAELVKNRRSIRQFTNEKITAEEVELIMKAALMAPTSKNCRSWRFVLVEDKEMLRQLALSKTSGAAFLEHCALAIVVLSDPVQSVAPIEDASIAAAFIQLQAEDLGLGSCWCQIAGRETPSAQDSEQYIRDLLSIPFQFGIICIIAIGRKDRIGKPHDEENLLWENVYIERFT